MKKNDHWGTILMLSLIFSVLCSGCITNDNNGETVPPTTTVAPTTSPPTTTVVPTTLPPTTVPPNVDTTPILASEVHAEFAEEKIEYEEKGEVVQELLDTLQDMVQAPNPDYEEIDSAFEQYQAEWREYRAALRNYYYYLILLEHTEPIEGDLLKLKKETLPFGRPDGKTYTYGELNMAAESLMMNYHGISSLLEDGIDGQDVREALLIKLQWLEDYLPVYYDMEIGYTYNHLSYYLFEQSLYSDILIRG